MRLTTPLPQLAAAAVIACSGAAGAASFVESGHLVLNTDVARIAFSLDTAGTDVQLYTDSWNGGANFDPELALWSKAGSDYTLVAIDDDADPPVGSQGAFDARFALPALAAGDYLLTVSASSNDPLGPLLSAGYQLSYGGVPTPIASWNQPSYDINANDQKGTFWEARLEGVDRAAVMSPVPEPSMWLLMALGLAGMGALRLLRGGTRD